MTRLKALYASARTWCDKHIVESIIIGTLAVLAMMFLIRGGH